jgi:hypothetical protein
MAVPNCANKECPLDEPEDTQCSMLTHGRPEHWFCSNGCIAEFVLEDSVQRGRLEQSTLDEYRKQRRLWL